MTMAITLKTMLKMITMTMVMAITLKTKMTMAMAVMLTMMTMAMKSDNSKMLFTELPNS